MADETDPEKLICAACGREPEVWTEEDQEVIDGAVVAGALKSGWMCQDQLHFMCEDHRPSSGYEADHHRIADALDSLDGRLAAEEDE